jgi:molybdate-binding protein/DNA-binding XRE family transcriptional regulator
VSEDAGTGWSNATGLRLARQARGFTQKHLADLAGVSRQVVWVVESGRSCASLRVALALARALGLSVEELFGPSGPASPVSACPVAPVGAAGSRVALAPIGGTFVALPLTGAAHGFSPATGLTVGVDSDRPQLADSWPRSSGAGGPQPMRLVRPIGQGRPGVVVAGDDPALPLLEVPLGLLDPPLDFTWLPCEGEEALRLAAGGLVHAAAAHLRGQSDGCRTGAGADLLGQGAEVIAFCSWRQGLVLRPELAASITGLADLRRAGLRMVNTEPGAQARRILDKELADQGIDPGQLPGYDTQATGHLQVAASISARLADAGVASEPAALAYGLAFVPLASEHVDLVIPAAGSESAEVRGLLKVLPSRWLSDQLASLPGYDGSHCGERVTALVTGH